MQPIEAVATAALHETLTHEQMQVRGWRRGILLKHGLTLADSRLLAESDADLHAMTDMLASGCPPDQLRRIVL